MLGVLFAIQLLALVLAGSEAFHPTPPDVSKHRNINLLPKSCGNTTVSSRIWGGEKTGIFEFPWMAHLAYGGDNSKFGCGGTIINERYILTAAHCLTVGGLSSVRVGDHNTKTDPDCQNTNNGIICAPPYQDLDVENIFTHDNYDRDTLENDIGLVRVSRIDLTQENVTPVCLPLKEARNHNFTNKEVVIAGWGRIEDGSPSPDLLKVSIPFVPWDVCKKIRDGVLHYSQICAGGVDNRDACKGDSGGPLLVNGTIDGEDKVVQQGIVSHGEPCGGKIIPGVYVKVSLFMDWILDHLEP